MGCWNATCNVSRLPIFCGDEIVVIPLIAVSATVTANTSYATDNFVPFSFPIVGKYNDYGGIEDAVITEENDKLIRSYEFYKSNGDGTAPYKVEIGDDMEKFISEELCGSDAYFIKTNNKITYPDGLALVSVFFVHKNLYDTLVHEMGERIPFNMSECQRDLLKKKFEYEVSLCRKNIEDIRNMQGKNLITKDFADDWKYASFGEFSALAASIFCRGEIVSPCRGHWKLLAEECVNFSNEGIIDLAVEKALFIRALSALRMGFHCDSGAGSQSCETHIHYVLAQYVLKYIREHTEEGQKCDTSTHPEEGTKEFFFFS
jgi:hypothetical protein